MDYSKFPKNKISVLPEFMVHKNYHVDLREDMDGTEIVVAK